MCCCKEVNCCRWGYTIETVTPTLTKSSGQLSSSAYAAINTLQVSTDTRELPLDLKFSDISRFSKEQNAYKISHVSCYIYTFLI